MIKLFVKRLYYCLLRLNGVGFSNYGRKTNMRRPIRIVGRRYIEIDDECDIMPGLRMEAIDQWRGKKYSPEIHISNNVVIGQNCHFTCANRLFIGKGVSILPNVLITDIEHEYRKDKTLFETDLNVGSIEIGDYCVIGMGAKIIGNGKVRIGKNVVIGANAIVKKDVPDDAIVVGVNNLIIGERAD